MSAHSAEVMSPGDEIVSVEGEHSGALLLSPDHRHLPIHSFSGFEGQNGKFRLMAAQWSFLSKPTLDPQGSFLQKWNRLFLISCVVSVAIDPLFFYTLNIDDQRHCLSVDRGLMIVACALRFLTDLFGILHIILQFRTGFISPSSRAFGPRVLIKNSLPIAQRCLSKYFLVDVLSILPLPQLLVLLVIPRLDNPIPEAINHYLMIVVFSQYIPRLIRILPVYKEVARAGMVNETALAGASLNLFLFIIASHVLGSFWYLFAIERESKCWHNECSKLGLEICKPEFLCCKGSTMTGKNSTMIQFPACILKNPDDIDGQDPNHFNYGIFFPALSTIVRSRDFPQKLIYCFWWGLRNLSSVGQNLQASPYIWENLFCVFICIAGLILFARLIGNMLKYLELLRTTNPFREEEMRVRLRDVKHWMSQRLLPESLRDRIIRHEQYKWQQTRGVDEENIIGSLPKDLKRDVKRYICLSVLMRVPMVKKMDAQLIHAMCQRLKTVLYTANSYIVREGDQVDEMLCIMRGQLKTMTNNGGRTSFVNLVHLKEGDFCGEELLTWALNPFSSSDLPISRRTVQTITEVEAFALLPDDIKSVALQFHKLDSKQMRHTFRCYSHHWRTWAACFIQENWRQHCRRKQQERAQRDREEKLKNALSKEEGSSLSLGSTIYASRFVANVLKSTRHDSAISKPRLPSFLRLQKPSEPDFSYKDE